MNTLVPDLVVVSRAILGLVFLLSALPKLRSLRQFASGLADLLGVPATAARVAGTGVVVVEVLLALALLFDIRITPVLPVALGLLLVFAVVLAVNALRPHPLACNCFGGVGGAPHPRRDLIRVALLLICAGVASLTEEYAPPIARWDGVVTAIGAVLLAYWSLGAGDVVALHRAKRLLPIAPRRLSYRTTALRSPVKEA